MTALENNINYHIFKIENTLFYPFCVLYAMYTGGLVLNFIVAAKIVSIGGFILPASVFIWALTFPLTDITAEVYGRPFANKLVVGGFVCMILMFAVTRLTLALPPAPFWDGAEAFEFVLQSSTRVMIAAFISYVICQFIDVYVFCQVRDLTGGRYLWLRNNISTLISQTLANTIFLSLAFWGTMNVENWIALYKSNLAFRYGLALFDTPFVYSSVYLIYWLCPELRKKTDTPSKHAPSQHQYCQPS